MNIGISGGGEPKGFPLEQVMNQLFMRYVRADLQTDFTPFAKEDIICLVGSCDAKDISNMMAKYPFIHKWEIGSEPQNMALKTGRTPQVYYDSLKACYELVKSKNPSDIVIGLGGSNIYQQKQNSTNTNSNLRWCEAVWQLGGGNYCDAISLHCYSKGQILIGTVAQIWRDMLSEYINLARKPIYVTEFGMQITHNQSLFAMDALNIFSLYPSILQAHWYNLAGQSGEGDLGLYDQSAPWSPRPVVQTLEAWKQ